MPVSGKSPGGEHGNPFQYSCLKNPTDRGAWWTTVHSVTNSWTLLKQHSACTHTHTHTHTHKHIEGECIWDFGTMTFQK